MLQNSLKNLRGRSVRLDIIAYDKQGKIYNIEVQRKDAGALPKRARYNSSMMDANITRPGEGLENLPETYVIFITENDFPECIAALPYWPYGSGIVCTVSGRGTYHLCERTI